MPLACTRRVRSQVHAHPYIYLVMSCQICFKRDYVRSFNSSLDAFFQIRCTISLRFRLLCTMLPPTCVFWMLLMTSCDKFAQARPIIVSRNKSDNDSSITRVSLIFLFQLLRILGSRDVGAKWFALLLHSLKDNGMRQMWFFQSLTFLSFYSSYSASCMDKVCWRHMERCEVIPLFSLIEFSWAHTNLGETPIQRESCVKDSQSFLNPLALLLVCPPQVIVCRDLMFCRGHVPQACDTPTHSSPSSWNVFFKSMSGVRIEDSCIIMSSFFFVPHHNVRSAFFPQKKTTFWFWASILVSIIISWILF